MYKWLSDLPHLSTDSLDPDIQTSGKLVSGKQTQEYNKIQENCAILSRTLANHVPPNDLANELFAAQLIGEDLKRQANRGSVDEVVWIDNLLAAVHNQIELNCTVFQKFIEILRDYDQLEELLKLLMNKLHEGRLATHNS